MQMHRVTKAGVVAAAAGLIFAFSPALTANASLVTNDGGGGVTGTTVTLTAGGQASLTVGAPSADPVTDTTEIDTNTIGDTDSGDGGDAPQGVNQTIAGASKGNGHAVSSSAQAKSNPGLGVNFQGLNFHDQRYANGGNQFSVEPPDQALCAGNGFVVEAVNDVFRVYHTDGTAATGVIDLNTFYGYPPAIVRSGPNAGQRGPTITDPSCIYDQATGRFFLTVLTLDHVGLTATENGNNHLDIAVSNSSDPTSGWTITSLPVQNNGTQGTPNHGCARGFCLGDYPHIGADANGIYLTTNEFSLFGSGFYGSQVYAISKAALVAGTASTAVLFNTLGMGPDGAGFTVWPASVPGTTFQTDNNGTEYFLSSNAVFSDDGTSSQILQWTMTNTASLNTATPAPVLNVASIPVNTYAVPPLATQPAGNRPLSQCIADTVIMPNCNTLIAGIGTHNNATFGPPNGKLNSNDSRMQQVMYANGKLWGSLDTAVTVGSQTRAGIAYYVVNPNSVKLMLQGQAGLASSDLTYPAVGVTDSGRGIIAFTLTGDSTYPSAGYASLDAKVGMGPVSTAAAGAGAWDGFTSYVAFGAGRPRWGDYGATSVVGGTIWAASEYVAQTCTYAQYLADFTCGGTRGALGNWSTHVSAITP
jgi:hypothetical protein